MIKKSYGDFEEKIFPLNGYGDFVIIYSCDGWEWEFIF